MIGGVQVVPLVVTVVVAIAMAVLGTVLAGDSLKTWYPTLRHPRFEPPVPLFALIGGVVYLVEAVILYRLLTGAATGDVMLGVGLLLGVMLANELWNAVLFRRRDLDQALASLVAFGVLVGVLVVVLFGLDVVSGWLMTAYLAWVVAFDLPWIVRLQQLNPAAP